MRIVAGACALIMLVFGFSGCSIRDKTSSVSSNIPYRSETSHSDSSSEQNELTDENINFSQNIESNILILVNKNNKLPDNYEPNLMSSGAKYSMVLNDDLQEMMQAAREDGVYLYVRDAFRTHAEQEAVFIELGEQLAAPAGYSEHQTGLAIDFSLEGNAEETAKTWEWLSRNSYRYGFILRYPEGKQHITGYDYEPWHYRYVGVDAATDMYLQSTCLEEYLGETINWENNDRSEQLTSPEALGGGEALPPIDN